MVRMAEVSLGKEGLDERALRIVFCAKPSLLLHHLSLHHEFTPVEQETLHTVSLKLQGQLDAVGCKVLEVGGVDLAGEGVVHPAVFPDQAGEGSFRVLCGALEHHMFKHMG